MTNESLLERLTAYCKGDSLPMHMPGHKRSDKFSHLAPLSSSLDITEICGFDDLNAPEDIFAESEALAAELWGSDMCLYSVNGSSGAILAGVRGALCGRYGEKIIMSRNAHRSVYNASELCGCVPVYLNGRLSPYGFSLSVDPSEVESALRANPDAALAVITSPTYEGVISDIRSIARICHEYGVPLMVDEAHGAHLGLHGIFPDGAVMCGADIAVHSLHKTLPSLTQTAAIHVSGRLVDKNEIKRQMAVFQTSSPSYLLSASVDGAVRYLATDDGAACMTKWHRGVTEVRDRLESLKHISLLRMSDGIFKLDVSKLVLCGGGVPLMEYFRREHKIELEMASAAYVTAMTGAGDTPESLSRLLSAVFSADLEMLTASVSCGNISQPRMMMKPSDAVCREAKWVPVKLATGHISASYVYAYPPGVPLLVPGEEICESFLGEAERLEAGGVTLRGIEKGQIRVIK